MTIMRKTKGDMVDLLKKLEGRKTTIRQAKDRTAYRFEKIKHFLIEQHRKDG